MLGNCEKMVAISSTTNEWPQNQILDDQNKGMNNMGSTGNNNNRIIMEKSAAAAAEQQQQNQQALKCPRCDSSNTKFCYYNNYSLSQPRHFCKACKRYWTRGGTLRNVPVGGGCRKNKRVKRPNSGSNSENSANNSSASSSSHSPGSININPHHHAPLSQIDISSSSNHTSPLFYGLPSNNFPFPSSGFNSRVSNVDSVVSGFDQLSGLGLGFSSSSGNIIMSSNVDHHQNNGFINSNNNPSKQIIQDLVALNPSLLSSYPSMFGGGPPNNSSSSTTPTMASLIASSLHQQQKFINGGMKERVNHFQSLMPFEDMHMASSGGEDGISSVKEVKMEESQNNRGEWNSNNNIPYNPNQIDQIDSSHDHQASSLYWNPSTTTTSLTAWPDLPNIGSSSVTSLI